MKSGLRCVLALLVTVFPPVWAQSTGNHSGHGVHDPAESAAPAAAQPQADDEMAPMPGMDHGGMQHPSPATQPEAASPSGTETMDHAGMSMPGEPRPADARDPHAYAGGYTLISGPYALPPQQRMHLADEHIFNAVLVNRLEYVNGVDNDNESAAYDVQAWLGNNYDRLVVKAEGDVANSQILEARTELLWGHAIASYWDTQLGVRHDSGDSAQRSWLAFGLQGLAPYWFEIDTTAYVGEHGRTAVRIDADYEIFFTQRLILQPVVEVNVYGKSDEARGVGKGLADSRVGLRLRYEFTRQFTPYIGIEWIKKYGDTADFAVSEGEDVSETRWVAGVRFWF